MPFGCHGVWSQKAIRSEERFTSPVVKGSSPRIPFRRVDLPHPTGPTTIVIWARGTAILMDLSTGVSLSHPKDVFSMLIACELRAGANACRSSDVVLFSELFPVS